MGKGECNYLDISVKSNYLDFRSKILDFTGVSKSVVDRKTKLVGYSFFDTFVEFVDLIKVYQYRQGDITEERGNTAPQHPDHGEESPRAVRPMWKAVQPLAFGLYYLSLNDSSFRTFSAAPCLGRFEPNAPGGGGGG